MAVTRKPVTGKIKTTRRVRKPARTTRLAKPDVVATLMRASAQVLALPIDPAWHAGVKFHLQVILHHAAIVDAFLPPDDIEPAPVFRA